MIKDVVKLGKHFLVHKTSLADLHKTRKELDSVCHRSRISSSLEFSTPPLHPYFTIISNNCLVQDRANLN